MALLLKDPRQFSQIYPESNILISQAIQDIATHSGNELMLALVEDILKQGQDQLLSIAYNLAPSQEVASYIWDTIQLVLNQPNKAKYAKLFAIPLTLVTGSTNQVILPSQVNQAQLQQLFIDKQIFKDTASAIISGELYDLDGLVKLKPSQLYTWINTFSQLSDWDKSQFSHKPVVNLGEGVHLRFLLGIVLFDKDQPQGMVGSNFSQLGLELLQILTTSLQTSGATIFPLPFAPCALSEAVLIGEFHRNEISLTVALSSLVKKMRLEGNCPEIKLSSQKSNIQIEIWGVDATAASKILLWPLHRSDDFRQVCNILEGLFADMQLSVSYYPESVHEEH